MWIKRGQRGRASTAWPVWLAVGVVLCLDPVLASAQAAGTARSYGAHRIDAVIEVDGRLEESVWAEAAFTETFVDIRGADHPAPTWTTRAKLLWDERHLYVAAVLEEPHLWATLTERDAIIYHDHDFEIFLDPGNDGLDYYELEINAFGTEFDLFLDKPYREGGRANTEWNMVGLRSAVGLDGSVNDPSDVDGGWTVEIAIPWTALRPPAAPRSVPPPAATPPGQPPVVGDRWRMNMSRVQWPLRRTADGYERAAEPSFEVHHEDNWVWSPQGEINMHIPERWGWLHFLGGRDS